MENSRHEKAAITVASYIIGLTTAYILFGNITSTSTPAFLPETPNMAASITATKTVDEPVAKREGVFYENGELKLVTTIGDITLSINPEITGVAVDGFSQGFHYGDLSYTVSEKKDFIFFCEQHKTTDETCIGYVYSVADNAIYPVTKSGVQPAISRESAKEAIFTVVGLKIGSSYSANPTAPWVLIDKDVSLD